MTPVPQHTRAREIANATRVRSAEYKIRIRSLSPAAAVDEVVLALRSGDEQVGPIKVRALLGAIKLMGDYKVSRVLMRAEVFNFERRVRDLTLRQREAVAEGLEDLSAGWTR